MVTFPQTVACVKVDGFGEDLPTVTCGFGDKTYTVYPSVRFKAICASHSDFTDLVDFVVNSINYGKDDFYISLPIYGYTMLWTARCIKIPTAVTAGAAFVREVDFEVQIINDIEDVLNLIP